MHSLCQDPTPIPLLFVYALPWLTAPAVLLIDGVSVRAEPLCLVGLVPPTFPQENLGKD